MGEWRVEEERREREEGERERERERGDSFVGAMREGARGVVSQGRGRLGLICREEQVVTS